MARDEEFLKRLISIFKVEAAEHISSISSGLFWLQNHTANADMQKGIESIYRSFHSLKGASRSVDFREMENLCQSMEELFSILKKGDTALSGDIMDQLLDTNDLLTEMISEFETGLSPEKIARIQSVTDRIDSLSGKAGKQRIPVSPAGSEVTSETESRPPAIEEKHIPSESEKDLKSTAEMQVPLSIRNEVQAETIRVPAARLETVMVKAEELVFLKLAARHYAAGIIEMKRILSQWNRQWAVSSEELQNLAMSEEENAYGDYDEFRIKVKDTLTRNESLHAKLDHHLTDLRKDIDKDLRSAGALVDDLLMDIKSLLLMPFSYVFETFPKLVRDISREQGKEVELIIEGGDVEIDKRVLQEMKDAFIHLIRNSIDHGIETAEERERLGKKRKGTLRISANQPDGGKIEVTFSDDGAGINPSKVRDAAVKHEIVTLEKTESMNDYEIFELIFESGLTTSPIVTTVSGRGLGMAIVKEKAERLGGTISIESARGEGTSFHLVLPVNIATFRGILIECSGHTFVVPTKNVERMVRVRFDDIRRVENRETVSYSGRSISLVRLSDILGIPDNGGIENDDYLNLMIVAYGSKYTAFSISGVLNEGEMLMKTLGKQLVHVRNISGATLLASGEAVPVLNVTELIKSALKAPASPSSFSYGAELRERVSSKKSILVVEDSITARSLYVNILESAGYAVSAAVDGIDGLTRLVNGNFDMVVTDIQMPKMNGFELTEKIRSDARYSSIPVILVTGLESADDKRRGIDAGANAYIVKSSFDQNNLLEVIRRFI